MAIPDSNIMGEGVDEDGSTFDLRFKFMDINESTTEWYGFMSFRGEKEDVQFNIDGGLLDHCFIKGQGTDVYGDYSIDGQIDKNKRTFHCSVKYSNFTISFKGQTNNDLTDFRGICEDP